MFANELRSAIESAPRMALGKLAVLLWRAFSAAQINDAEYKGEWVRCFKEQGVTPPAGFKP